jgi:cobalamin biosynthesis Mg chelatase CobN
MANAPGTGTRPSSSPNNTSHDNAPNNANTTATSEVSSMKNRVNVYDSDGSTTPTGAASTTPGEWRITDDESRDRNSTLKADPAPVSRSGASWVTTVIALIVIVLIAYFIMQLLF